MFTHCRAMDNLWIYAIVFLASPWCGLFQTPDAGDIEEICQWETFNATCAEQEAVVMTSAQYGRMTLSRCMATEVYIGCSANILSQVDTRCSGRQACEISVPDSILHRQQPCPKDMMAYLQASYMCVKVSYPDQGHQCAHSVPIPLSAPSGYLSNAVTNQYGYGSATCPWLLKVAPGQRIRFFLYDFTLDQRYSSSRRTTDENTFCIFYAILLDKAKDQEFTVCAGLKRHHEVYTSYGNEVEVQVPQQNGDEQPGEKLNFLLQYSAIGCPDPKPPPEAWVRRMGEKATVSCNFTSEAWHLVCKGNEWVGEFKNCTLKKSSASDLVAEDANFPSYGLIVAIVIGVSLGIVCGFAMLAAVLLCRKKDRWHMKGSLTLSSRGGGGGSGTTTYGVASTHASATSTPCKVHRLAGGPGSEYGYTHVWEVQQGPLTTLTPHPHLSAHYAAFRECERHGGSGVPTVLYRCADNTCEQHTIEDLTTTTTPHSTDTQMPPFYHDNQPADGGNTILKQQYRRTDSNKHHSDCPLSAHPVGGQDTDEELDIGGQHQQRPQHNGGYHLVPSSPDKADMPTVTGQLEHNHYS